MILEEQDTNKMEKENTNYPRVLIQSGQPRGFRGSTIASLYEIAQVYPVILLSEELDSETEKLLHDKKLFPKLEKIIPYRQFTGAGANPLFKNSYKHYKLAKKVIEEYKPDIILAGDTYLLQLYLGRFAKKLKPVIHFATQGTLFVDPKDSRLRAYLLSAYLRTPSFLPFFLRMFLVKCRKLFAHFIYYWILPLMIGEKPFLGKSSAILWTGAAGIRSCDYFLVYSRKDVDLAIKAGVLPEKVYILPPPLAREKTKQFFEKTFFSNSIKEYKSKEKTVTIMYSGDEIGFKKNNHSLISKQEMEKTLLDIVNSVSKTLEGWKIFVKPHPDTQNMEDLKQKVESVSPNITVTNPSDSADKYIEISDVIIGPSPASTTLFTASLQSKDKIILSLDFDEELCGDLFENSEGIEYIKDEGKFLSVLKEIKEGRFSRQKEKEKSVAIETKEFSSIIEALEYFMRLQKHD